MEGEIKFVCKAKVVFYRMREWRKVWIGVCVAERRGAMGDADNAE